MCIKTNYPLVSVIIPNYNHAKFLDERIQSVLNQTYQNFELIILDDKSTDNSVEIINQYKDNPHVSHIVVNEENSGSTFKQWHKGFELAKGNLIWIAESDDSCDSSLLGTLVRGYVDNSAVLAFCRSCKYDIDGKKTNYAYQDNLLGDIMMPGRIFISNYMVRKNAIANASSAIFSRNVAISVDNKYMTMRGEGDWLFWVELMEKGNVYFCSEVHNFFRFHGSNTTNTQVIEGISAIEHKITFDYLVEKGHIKPSDINNEKLGFLYCCMKADFFSRISRRQVLMVWDKYYTGRLKIFLSCVKDAFVLLLRNL